MFPRSHRRSTGLVAALTLLFSIGACRNPRREQKAPQKDSLQALRQNRLLRDSVNNAAHYPKLIHEYLRKKGVEEGQGDFLLKIQNMNLLGQSRLLGFSDANEYSGDSFNGLALLDSSGAVSDCYIFSADSVGIKSDFSDRFKMTTEKNTVQLDYTVRYLAKAGEAFLSEKEEQYWRSHPELPRPNENRYGFSDVPAEYVDTLQVQKKFLLQDNRLVPVR